MNKVYFLFLLSLGSLFAQSKIIYIMTHLPNELNNILLNNPKLVFKNTPFGRKLFPRLKKRVYQETGYILKTPKSYKQNLNDATYIICADHYFHHDQLGRYPIKKRILFMIEPPSIIPRPHSKQYQNLFGKIFTWRDDLVDNKKYFKYFDYVGGRKMGDPVPFDQKKFCCLVARNHSYRNDKRELYSERIKTIQFFEQNYPHQFDLFGFYWGKKLKVFKGPIKRTKQAKIETLKNYKYYICYENTSNIHGYISEKIFDCFQAGCLPIYWGASNVTDHIPINCFIDRRNFESNEQLFGFLQSITKEEYESYIAHIQEYLASDQAKLFSIDSFIDHFITIIQS